MDFQDIVNRLDFMDISLVSESNLEKIFKISPFFEQQLTRFLERSNQNSFIESALKSWMLKLDHPVLELDWLHEQIRIALPQSGDQDQCMNRLRIIRNLFQMRAVYQEIEFFSSDEQYFVRQMKEYSLFAELLFNHVEVYLRQRLSSEWRLKVQPPQMMIFALGKLGAGELNLSSDVDLIFCYDHKHAYFDDQDRSASEFYTRLGQRFIKFLNDFTLEGIIYRVDMRLRPFGQSGALVWSDQALETYYEQQGRMWERYAWIKARPLAGGMPSVLLAENMRRFVYRRYVDFGVIDALRDMKALIEKEVNRKEGKDNIKIGRGGIREIEFIVQVIQLVRGGEFPELRQHSMMEAMTKISQLQLLPAVVIADLRQSYLFLRQVEHFIQAYQDRQTQTLPVEMPAIEALALALRFESIELMFEKINLVRAKVHHHFQETIRPASKQETYKWDTTDWTLCWSSQLSNSSTNKVIQLLYEFSQSKLMAKASEISHQRLDELMPLAMTMIEVIAEKQTLDRKATLSHQLQVKLPELDICCVGIEEILKRFLGIVEAILRRSVYIALLIENPQALFTALQLCSMTALVPEKLARYPSLLDECIDSRPLTKPPSRDALIDELRQHLMRIPEDDFEQQMNRLRAFKQRHTLRAAKADITGTLPLMNVSDYLTWVAEASLQAALDIAWRKLVLKYGEPQRYLDSGTGFLIVGYGKLGGIEMSYSSDLDLVFLYDAAEDGVTDGSKSIDNSMFYIQLVKNLNHILMTDTLDGRLYEIDMRLRPSGSSGLFVSTFDGFKRYQEEKAWTWERQALVRARPVAGDAHLFDRFTNLRKVCLQIHNDQIELRTNVLEMRQKMKDHLAARTHNFDLKFGAGGLVDIEFLAQHLVLNHAQEYEALTQYPDNVRIFEAAEEVGLLNNQDATQLTHAYLVYRALIHRLSLQQQTLLIAESGLQEIRRDVVRIFSNWFEC